MNLSRRLQTHCCKQHNVRSAPVYLCSFSQRHICAKSSINFWLIVVYVSSCTHWWPCCFKLKIYYLATRQNPEVHYVNLYSRAEFMPGLSEGHQCPVVREEFPRILHGEAVNHPQQTIDGIFSREEIGGGDVFVVRSGEICVHSSWV